MSQPSVRKNFIFRACYEVLLLLTPLITTPYVARVLNSDGLGIASYTGSIMAFFTMFAALGTPQYGMREIARNRDHPEKATRIFWEIELLTVLTSSVCLLVWLGVCFFYREYSPYLYALIPTLLGTMFDISWFFTAYEKVGYTVGRNAVFKILGIVLLFTFIKSRSDLLLYIFLMSLTGMLGALSMWTYLPRMLVRTDLRGLQLSRHFHETLVYFVPTIATSIYTILDKFLLGVIVNNNDINGYYDQAGRLYHIINALVFTALNAVMEARISWLFAQGAEEEIRHRIRRSMDFTMLLGFGGVFGIVGIAKVFVPLFWGPGWDRVETLIYLMAPLTLIIGVSYCLGSLYYNPSGNRAQSARYLIIGACVNLVMNLLLIPRWNAVGAVIASLIAESTITFLYVRNCRGYLTVQTLADVIWRRLLAGAAMCLLVMSLGRLPVGKDILKLAIQILSGAAFYIAVLYLAKDAMLRELLNLISETLKRLTGRERK
ncbi:MAG: oligosaccharide flippase family protein [Oscillospiraceae bacterium]|nr:oligosaccharide flippase family protein [Oscillospiraceae bacterium]